MTSELRVDNLKGSTTGGSINVLDGGGSSQTNLQDGLAKAFYSVAHESGTPTTKESLNISSHVDNGTGNILSSYTTNMSIIKHCVLSACSEQSIGVFSNLGDISSAFETGRVNLRMSQGNTSLTRQDVDLACISVHGDLA
tara:strand:+ start:193 stop:612 length:420 start_codon:yes stop_codon:yes gene_type:complete